MSHSLAIIGDIHGNVEALSGLLRTIEGGYSQMVLVGDYVDRGPDSAEVIQMLIDFASSGVDVFCIAGNHDLAFRACLEEGRLVEFLQIGGAATIQSYIATPEPDTLAQLRRSVPKEHVAFLRALQPYYLRDNLLVTHGPSDFPQEVKSATFHVFGHVPQPGFSIRIDGNSAAIDTGCGTLPAGRLTCLAWPSLDVTQVDSTGQVVTLEES